MSLIRQFFSQLLLLTLIAVLGNSQGLSANAERVIELNDGSRIFGVIVGYENGVYTIESQALGNVRMPDAKVRSIYSPSHPPAQAESQVGASPDSATLSQIERYQARILEDPGALPKIMSLQQDPSIVDILNDPQIMQAIMSGDISTLQNNPKIRRLESNQTIRQLLQRFNQ